MLRMCFIGLKFQVRETQAKISMNRLNGYYFKRFHSIIVRVNLKTHEALIEEFGEKYT